MSINLSMPEIKELKPRITVFGVGGAGGNAVNNMITSGLNGVEFVVANTDAQALSMSKAERLIQMGVAVTQGLGAGSQPQVGAAAADEVIDEIKDHLAGSHMVFVTAGMGGGTGTGAAPVIAGCARDMGILTVGVVTKPFQFEGQRRMATAEQGITDLQAHVDTLIVIPNQNLFRVANEKTTFADAFSMADEVLYSGVACITDLMVKEGLINLDFADVRSVMREMGKAMMGTGEASGDKRAVQAAEAAIANPLLDETSMKGAKGLLISITGGNDLTLFEVDEAASRIRNEVDDDANIILGATFDETLDGVVRVSVVATGIDSDVAPVAQRPQPTFGQIASAGLTARTPAAEVRAAPAPKPVPAPVEMRPEPVIEPEPAKPVIAETTRDDVTIRRVATAAPDVSLPPVADIEEPASVMTLQEEPEVSDEPFIPPVAERPESRPRLPQVEDFPPIAQAALKAHREETAVATHEPGKSGGLFGRIAAGLGIRENHDDHAAAHESQVRAPEPRPAAEPPVSQHESAYGTATGRPSRSQDAVGEEHEARKKQDLGMRPAEDDQLEIPAFLRRQNRL